jgi:glucose/arabinose dehydrogenase
MARRCPSINGTTFSKNMSHADQEIIHSLMRNLTALRRLLALLAALFALPLALLAHAEKTHFDLMQLKAPPGFHISVFANDIDGARMMIFTPGGVLLASESGEGKVVALPDPKHTGKATRAVTVLDGLNEPHGLAFYQGKLYVAENDKVRSYDWDEANLKASNPKKLADLATGGGHSTRTVLFHNGKMYIAAGSSCNVCIEKDPRRAAVTEYNPDGSGQKVFAKGLRNAVGLAVNPKTDTIWVTVNGRDWLGDDLPPETIYDLGKDGGDAGWPFCYDDRTFDSVFAKSEGTKVGEDRCKDVLEPKVQMQAHSAPLGLAFYEGSEFPAEYQNNIFVAFHGSWNRNVPTGYKVVRVKLDGKGQPVGGAQDFITGWLAPGETQKGRWMGRPVGIVVGSDGSMYLSDDSGGVIYRITYAK